MVCRSAGVDATRQGGAGRTPGRSVPPPRRSLRDALRASPAHLARGVAMKRAWLFLALLLMVPASAHAAPVRIGSKQFTESVILGEIARLAARQQGVPVVH